MKLFLTGATGFLGGAIGANWLARPGASMPLFLVRAADPAQGLQRLRAQLKLSGVPDDMLNRISAADIVCGDLETVPSFSADPRLDSVDLVISSAALATFSQNPKLRPVNVDGTFALAERFSRNRNLHRFLQIGTAMCCGPGQPIPVVEDWKNGVDVEHVVPYTRSKLDAELMIREKLPSLPLICTRPSIVVGDTKLGCGPSPSIFWVFRMAQLLGAFTCGLDERIDVIPVDWCAEALVSLALKPTLKYDLYHVSAGASSDTFADIDIALAEADHKQPWGARYRKVGREDMRALAEEFASHVPEAHPRLIMRAMRIYGGFAEMNYVFDNQRMLDEGVVAPPRLVSYLGTCLRSVEGRSMLEMMQSDFK
jgi:thioester reductase-like protein